MSVPYRDIAILAKKSCLRQIKERNLSDNIYGPALPGQTSVPTFFPKHAGGPRAVAGKLDRFPEKHFREFVPESFRWTVYKSRPGTNISFSRNRSSHSVDFEGFVASNFSGNVTKSLS